TVEPAGSNRTALGRETGADWILWRSCWLCRMPSSRAERTSSSTSALLATWRAAFTCSIWKSLSSLVTESKKRDLVMGTWQPAPNDTRNGIGQRYYVGT